MREALREAWAPSDELLVAAGSSTGCHILEAWGAEQGLRVFLEV